nr:hypothetical protein [Pseudomonas aeruginosa]
MRSLLAPSRGRRSACCAS